MPVRAELHITCHELVICERRYVRGEAVVSMGLSLRGADDTVGAAGIVLGTAINQDGRSSSLTAPNGPSQQQVCTDLCCACLQSAPMDSPFVPLLRWLTCHKAGLLLKLSLAMT